MLPEERDAALLWDMLESARAILSYVSGLTYEQFKADRMIRRAVEREIEIVGEAARRVSPLFREAHPEVPWAIIVGQRNFLAHDYNRTDDGKIWEVAAQDIPELIGWIEPLVPPERA